MNIRHIGLLGIGVWIWFWSVSLVLGALRPGYSPVVNTLSELGAAGTPNAVIWNVLGFIVTGVAVAIVGATIARTVVAERSMRRTAATIALVLSGLAVAGQGLLPAEMINGVADIESAATRAHFISSLISGPAWAIGVLLLFGPMKRSPEWRGLHLAGIVLLILTPVASLALRGTLPDGLAQRTGNLFFCVWFVLMSLTLIQIGRQRAGG